ncbi:hypothetical protein VTJ49DRAFT_1722 [Mycothermus thermophilus]|uniref:GST N-terminal domain-containing protein n=1 Tax=Humicola insolens TaxID=85995 RepID=A0ABR3VBL7_HUMIN
MRPDLLPPLQIPQTYSSRPVLLGKYRYPTRPDQPVFFHTPSYSYLTYKPLPPPPSSRRLVDFDDIDVFKFYHPCVLPPSPIVVPTRPNTEPAELPGCLANPPPYSQRDDGGAGAEDQTRETNSNEAEIRVPNGERGDNSAVSQPSSPGSSGHAIASPSPLQPPQRRRPPLLDWDIRSSVRYDRVPPQSTTTSTEGRSKQGELNMSEPIILFDIPSREPRRCWTLNPWKTRMLLNFKGLDYRTEWLEYPEIHPRLEPHLPPNPGPNAVPYTIPTIRLPSGEYVMDSRVIAERIEALYPTPSARLDSAALARLYDLMPRLMAAIRPIFSVRVPKYILSEASQEYWYRTRGERVGMPVEEFAAKNPEKECWDRADEVVKEVTGMLTEGGGPFFLGEEVSYADFVWGGLLIFLKRQGEEEVYGELLRRSGDGEVHERFLKALEPWTKRDSE